MTDAKIGMAARNAEASQVDWGNYTFVADLFDFYLSIHAAWGSLHIVFEDGNIDRASVQFCQNWAVEHKDWLGAYLASVLLGFTDSELEKLKEPIGMQALLIDILMDRGG